MSESLAIRVWVDPGCTSCGWCGQLAPAVFQVGQHGSEISAAVRCDGSSDDNWEHRSPLRENAIDAAEVRFLHFVAAGCPAQVIHVDDPTANTQDPVSGLPIAS